MQIISITNIIHLNENATSEREKEFQEDFTSFRLCINLHDEANKLNKLTVTRFSYQIM
jgi:hypothetical protein